jgi:hypothetical protein
MNRYFAQVIAESGIAAAPLGAILPVLAFEHLGQMRESILLGVQVDVGGGATVFLRAGDIEILDPATAKRRRLAQKRSINRAAPDWRGAPDRPASGLDSGPISSEGATHA